MRRAAFIIVSKLLGEERATPRLVDNAIVFLLPQLDRETNLAGEIMWGVGTRSRVLGQHSNVLIQRCYEFRAYNTLAAPFLCRSEKML